jgi:hypothetical protein
MSANNGYCFLIHYDRELDHDPRVFGPYPDSETVVVKARTFLNGIKSLDGVVKPVFGRTYLADDNSNDIDSVTFGPLEKDDLLE